MNVARVEFETMNHVCMLVKDEPRVVVIAGSTWEHGDESANGGIRTWMNFNVINVMKSRKK